MLVKLNEEKKRQESHIEAINNPERQGEVNDLMF